VNKYPSFLDTFFVFLQLFSLEEWLDKKFPPFENVRSSSDQVVKFIFVSQQDGTTPEKLLFNTFRHIVFDAWHFYFQNRCVAKVGNKVLLEHS